MLKNVCRNTKTNAGYLTSVLFVLTLSSFGQNLVPNPGFEEDQPTKPGRTFTHGGAPFQKLIGPWYMPTRGTSDFYNSDHSNIQLNYPVKTARSGQGRTGAIYNTFDERRPYTEYIQVKLKQPLDRDSLYCVGMHFSLDKRNRYYGGALGICFTQAPMTDTGTGPFKVAPQLLCTDTVLLSAVRGWQCFRQVYKATGGEQYLTIGRFGDAGVRPRKVTDTIPKGLEKFARYAYYYYDDISVVPLNNRALCSDELEEEIKPAENNFLFLVDVSSSMIKEGYLSQVKATLLKFADSLGHNDVITLMGFDARTRVLLQSARVHEKQKIIQAVDQLQGGTVTNINKAISDAYTVMDSTLIPQAGNQVVLLSDARFELSSTSKKTIKAYFKERRVGFSTVQFGQAGNKDLKKITALTKSIYLEGGDHLHEGLLKLVRRQQRKRFDYTPMRAGALTFEVY